MSAKDSKDRRDIESEVIDTLLDAIDDWDLEADVPADQTVGDFSLDSSVAQKTQIAPAPVAPASDEDPFGLDVMASDAIEPEGEAAPEEEPYRSSGGSPLYLPPLDFGEAGLDDESTRMIDMRADETYHDLVRSIREQEQEEDGGVSDEDIQIELPQNLTPLEQFPISPKASPFLPAASAEPMPLPPTVVAQSPVSLLTDDDDDETFIYSDSDADHPPTVDMEASSVDVEEEFVDQDRTFEAAVGEAGDEQLEDLVAARSPAPGPVDGAAMPPRWGDHTAISPMPAQRVEPHPAGDMPTPVPSPRGEPRPGFDRPTPLPAGAHDDRAVTAQTEIPAMAFHVTDRQVTVERELPDWIAPPAVAPATPGPQVPMTSVADAALERAPAPAAPRRVEEDEEPLPQDLAAALENLLPRGHIKLPGGADALPPTPELLARLDAIRPAPATLTPARVAPAALAARFEAEAEQCADVAEASAFLCEAARLRERRLGDPGRAREIYALALQLEPGFAPAVSGRRRAAVRTCAWDGLELALDAELELKLGPEERLELLHTKGELLVSAVHDPGRAVDVCQAIEELNPGDIRAEALRLEVAYLEQDEGELASRAVALAGKVADPALRAALLDTAGRVSESVADHETALRHFEGAAEANGSSPSVLAGLARARAATGNGAGSARVLVDLSQCFGPGLATTSFKRRAAEVLATAGDLKGAAELLSASRDRNDLVVLLRTAYELGDAALQAATLQELADATDDPVHRASLVVEAAMGAAEIDSRRLVQTLATCRGDGSNVTAIMARSELARRGQDVEAIEATAATTDDESTAAGLFRRALSFDANGRPDKAHELFARLVAMNEARSEAELALLVLAAASQNWQALANFYHKVADHSPSPLWKASIMVGLGRLNEFELGDRVAARAGYGRASELVPGFLSALQGLKRTAPDAATRFEATRRLADEERSRIGAVALLIDAGRIAEQGSSATQALEAYGAALAREPSAIIPLLGAERLLRKAGRLDELLALWRQAAGTTTGAVSAHHRLCVGRVLEGRNELQAAAEAYALALDARPSDITVAGAIVKLSQSSAFAERLEQVAEFLPLSRRAATLITAAELWADESPEEALRCAARAHELRPGWPEASMLEERLLRRLGRVEELEARLEGDEGADRRTNLERLIGLAIARGDREAETARREAFLALDPRDLPTLHALASSYLAAQRWADLAPITQRLAEELRDDADAAAYAAMTIRLRSAIEQRPFASLEAAELAARRQPGDLRALLNLYHAAHLAGRWELVHTAAAGLASTLALPRSRAVFELRAADALEALGRTDEALDALGRASSGEERHPIASWRRSRLAESQGRFVEAAEAAEATARSALAQEHKTEEYLRAARLWLDSLGDRDKALAALRGALAVDPTCDDAFEIAKSAIGDDTDPALALDLVSMRLKGQRTSEEIVELATKGADLAFSLGDRVRAKELLRTVLEAKPNAVEALRKLAETCAEDQDWPEAGRCFIQLGRLIKDPKESMGYYFRLGVVYQDKTPDLRRAIASFQKVLSFDPKHPDALRRLSGLLVEAHEWKAACDVTLRLSQVETDPALKRVALMRLAQAYELGLSDTWRAEQTLNEARALDPTDMSVIEAIAAFYSRQDAVPALNVHLDRAASDFRRTLETEPLSMSAYHSLFRVFTLRQSEDRARLAAAVLQAFGEANEAELALLARFRGADWTPGPGVADVRLDEDLATPAVSQSLRTVLQQTGEHIGRLIPQDLRRLGLGRAQKLGRGAPVFELARSLMAWYGLSGVEVFVHPTEPAAWMLINSSPPALVLGQALVEGCGEGEIRFVLCRAFALLQRKLGVLLQFDDARLAVLLPALVKLLYPAVADPEDVDQAALAEMARELNKVLPKRVRQEVGPFALECAGEARLSPAQLREQVEQFADRAALLAAGGLGPALGALRRLRGLPPTPPGAPIEKPTSDPRAGALLRFFVSEAHASARAKYGFAAPI